MFTRHKFLLVTVKEWLKSVLNYRSYPKKTGYPFFGPPCTASVLLPSATRSDKHCKFPTEEIMGTQNLNFALKGPQNGNFSAQILHLLPKIFRRKDLSTIFQQPKI